MRIDGENDGAGGKHTRNDVGLYPGNSSNLTFNDIQGYGHNIYPIYLWFNKNVLINNYSAYNNGSYGISLAGTTNTVINNSKFYNSSQYGIQAGADSSQVAVNNSLLFSNGSFGMILTPNNGIVINNIQSYNNNYFGVQGAAIDTKMNNVRAYSNANAGVYSNPNAIVKYYGNNILFNPGGNMPGTTGLMEYAYLGWSSGTITQTPTMSCDRVANPRLNINGSMMQTGATCNTKSYMAGRSGLVNGILYGENMATQIQPVMFSNQELTLSRIPYSTGKFIAETDPLIYIKILSPSSGTLVNTTSPVISGYLRQGYARLSGTIVTSTGIAGSMTGISNSGGNWSVIAS